MKTTVDLPDPLFRRAKATAAVNGVSLKSLITRAVEESLAKSSPNVDDLVADLPVVPARLLKKIETRVAAADIADLDLQRSPGK